MKPWKWLASGLCRAITGIFCSRTQEVNDKRQYCALQEWTETAHFHDHPVQELNPGEENRKLVNTGEALVSFTYYAPITQPCFGDAP